MRISDVFVMGGGYGNGDSYGNSGTYGNYDEACYGHYPYCHRSYEPFDYGPRRGRLGQGGFLGIFG